MRLYGSQSRNAPKKICVALELSDPLCLVHFRRGAYLGSSSKPKARITGLVSCRDLELVVLAISRKVLANSNGRGVLSQK